MKSMLCCGPTKESEAVDPRMSQEGDEWGLGPLQGTGVNIKPRSAYLWDQKPSDLKNI